MEYEGNEGVLNLCNVAWLVLAGKMFTSDIGNVARSNIIHENRDIAERV